MTRPELNIWLKLAMAACFSICIGATFFVVASNKAVRHPGAVCAWRAM